MPDPNNDTYQDFAGLTPPYRTIVADPPWPYDGFARSPGRGANRPAGVVAVPLPYSSMTLVEILALPVAALADRDCRLFLWTTNRYLPAGPGVMAAWGFRYAQTLVWHKTGCPSPFGGSVAPNHAEYLLVGARGSPPVRDRAGSSVVSASRDLRQAQGGSHSAKPRAFGDLIEQVSPGPYLELFARSPRLGWDSWGYGYEATA